MKSDLKDFLQTFAAEGKVSLTPREPAHDATQLRSGRAGRHMTVGLSCDRW